MRFPDRLRLGAAAPLVREAIGLLLTGGAALAAVWVFHHAQHRSVAPFLFLVIVALIARAFGSRVAFLGTLLAAAVFAFFLFPPLGSLQIGDADSRRSLLWMLLLGVILADFIPAVFCPPQQRR